MVCRAAAGCRKLRDAAIDPHRSSGRAPRSRTAGAPPLDGLLDEAPGARGARGPAKPGRMTSAAIAAQRLGGGRNVAMSVAKARRRAAPGLLARLRGRLPRVRPLRALTISAFAVALVGIVANAMVFQHGRHPAPLFGLGRSLDGQVDADRQAATPVPSAPVPAERTGSVPPPAPAPAAVEPAPAPVAAKPAPAAVPPAHHAAGAKPRHEDGIGSLLAAKPGPHAAHPRPGAAAAAAHRAELKAAEKTKPQAEAAAADRRAAADAAAILKPARAHGTAAAAHPRPHARPAGEAAKAPVKAATRAVAAPGTATE